MDIDVGPSFKKVLTWTEPSHPNDFCWYDHVIAKITDEKCYIIEWKSWKEFPQYDLYLITSEDWDGRSRVEYFDNLDEAKDWAERYNQLQHK